MHSLGLSRAKTNQNNRFKKLVSDKDADLAHTFSAFCYLLSAILQDSKTELNTHKQKEPTPGLQFSEVMYADDTLICGTHTPTIQQPHMRYNQNHKSTICS